MCSLCTESADKMSFTQKGYSGAFDGGCFQWQFYPHLVPQWDCVYMYVDMGKCHPVQQHSL